MTEVRSGGGGGGGGEARVSAGKSCPNFALCLAFYHDFWCADFEMISYSGRSKLAQILNSESFVSFSIFIPVRFGKKSFGFSSFFLKRLRFLFIYD
jgi:hypothetical protein